MTDERPSPDFQTLVLWLEGRLPEQKASLVAEQVRLGDLRVQRSAAWLRGFLAVAADLPLHDPPPLVRQRLRQYFRAWSQAKALLEGAPEELTASLLFDSRQDLVLAGARSADGQDSEVHLAFTCEAADLVIDLAPDSAGTFRLDGQVLTAQPGDAPMFEAVLSSDGFSLRSVDGDDTGAFVLSGVPPSDAQLTVSNGLISISADLRIGPPGV